MMPHLKVRARAIGLVLVFAGCGDDDPLVTEPAPTPAVTAITAVSGDLQTGVAGELLPNPIVLRTFTTGGAVFPGVAINVLPQDSEGLLRIGGVSGSGLGTILVGTSDANGELAVEWTLPTTAGFASFRAVAFRGNSDTVDVFVNAEVVAGQLANVLQEGDNQLGAAGQGLSRPLAVVVVDRHGNPIEGVDVTWAVLSGGGSLAQPVATTDAEGRSSVELVLGATVGDQRVSAAIGSGGGTVVFTAVAQ